MSKKIQVEKLKSKKRVIVNKESTDNEKVIWIFDWIDTDGNFAFNPNREDFDCRKVLEKIISFSNQTWAEIKKATHDKGKSKHHMLSYDGISQKGKDRIKVKHLEEYNDSIFSFALENKIRIIGIRDGNKFHVIWFDLNHEFFPSKK